MKKIFLLFFLTIVSLGYSQVVDYCATPRASTNHGGSYLLNYTSRNVSGTTYEMKLEFANVTSGAANANIGANPGGVNVAANPVWSNGNQTLIYQFTASSTPTLYVATIFVMINGIEVRWDLPTNSNFAAVCSSGGGQDTEAPTNFTASLGTITSNSVELLLNGEDNSGAVTYNISYGSGSASTTGVSGVQKSFIVSGLTSDTLYNFSIQASDATGNNATNNPIVLAATTLENTNTNCSGQSTEASQSSFTTGYNYNFSTSGSDVTVEFELLDNRDGVVAYTWTYNPNFSELPMTLVSGRKFTRTFTGQAIGSTFTVACKFAFSGGLAVTKQFTYTVGDNCNGGGTLLNPSFEPWSIASKQVGDADFEITPPISTSSGAFTYFSSNTSVATINGNEIQIVGGGTTTITANQAATEEYNAGSTTATFTVTVPPLAVAAPTPPARNSWDVISVFSDAYTPVEGTRDYNPNWGQSGFANFEQPLIEGNQALKYSGVNYQGINIGSTIAAIDAGMTHVHIDIYTTNCPNTDFRLVEGGQDRSKVVSTPVGVWNSFDIPLSEFAGLNGNLIEQLKFQRSPFNPGTDSNEWYFDNIYFYRPATLLTPTITDFTVPTKALGDASFALTAPTSNSSGAFTYTSSNESVATINGNMVTIVGTGTTTITATQAAAGDYDTGSITADFQVTVPIIPVSITSPSCGSILNYRNASISCNAVSVEGHTVQYRFRIQNENFDVSVLRDVPNFTILQASYAAYVHPAAATYNVYVSLVVDGEPQPEAETVCTISVPAVALPTQGLQNCDTVLTTPSTLVFGPSVSGAVEYQFEISLGGNVVTTLTRPSNYFHSSTNFTEWNYGTTYTVKMKARKSNETFDQLAFGTACNLTYPAIPAQTQALVNCSNTLSTVSTLVFTPSVFGATSYRFELNDGSTTYTVTRPNAYFHFTTDFPEWNYGKTYSVKVQVARNNNVYGPLSTNACTLTSPAMPTPAQALVNCATVMTSPTSLLFAPAVFGATSYVFNVTGFPEITKEVPYFRLSDMPGWVAGTVYSVTVKAIRNGVESGISSACTFKTPGTAPVAPVARIAQVPFAVKAYPNPYSNAFQLDVASSDRTASIDVKVFDMLGRMVDSKNTTAGDLETATIGSDYPSGVYNVIVTQGEQTKVVRVVKR